VNPRIDQPAIVFPSIESLAAVGRPTSVTIENRTIHVWSFSLEASAQFMEQCRFWLSEEERRRAARFIQRQDQLRFVLAHGGLRAVLARYTSRDPSALTFQCGATGKPALSNESAAHYPLRFNLSHSHGRMLIAVAGKQDVGIDLERVREKADLAKLAERFYAPSERDRVISLSGPDQAHWFYRYWVAKESILKGQAVGLQSLQHCEIRLTDHLSRANVHVREGATLQPEWTIHWLDCGSGWAGAVSAHGNDWGIRTMTSE
jgi:4'-phosphopantetheinyl transferase